jgi:Glycosyl Hydrolase Family 88
MLITSACNLRSKYSTARTMRGLFAWIILLLTSEVRAGTVVVDEILLSLQAALKVAPLFPGLSSYCGWNYECATALHTLFLDECLNLNVLVLSNGEDIRSTRDAFLRKALVFPQPGGRIASASYGFSPGDRIGLFGALYYYYNTTNSDIRTRRNVDAIQTNVKTRLSNWPLARRVFARATGWLRPFILDFTITYLMGHRTPWIWIDDSFMGGYPFVTTSPEKLGQLLLSYNDALRDPADGLWWHGAYVNLQQDLQYNGVKWGRGNAWLLLSMTTFVIRTTDAVSNRADVITLWLDQLSTLVPYQRLSGAFGNVLNSAESPDETSMTSIFVFAVGTAVHFNLLTVLSEEVLAAEKAWVWLNKRTAHNMTLSETCAAQNLALSAPLYDENVGQSSGTAVSFVLYAAMGYRMIELAE